MEGGSRKPINRRVGKLLMQKIGKCEMKVERENIKKNVKTKKMGTKHDQMRYHMIKLCLMR